MISADTCNKIDERSRFKSTDGIDSKTPSNPVQCIKKLYDQLLACSSPSSRENQSSQELSSSVNDSTWVCSVLCVARDKAATVERQTAATALVELVAHKACDKLIKMSDSLFSTLSEGVKEVLKECEVEQPACPPRLAIRMWTAMVRIAYMNPPVDDKEHIRMSNELCGALRPFFMIPAHAPAAFEAWRVFAIQYSLEEQTSLVTRRAALLMIPLQHSRIPPGCEREMLAAWWAVVKACRKALDQRFEEVVVGLLLFCSGRSATVVDAGEFEEKVGRTRPSRFYLRACNVPATLKYAQAQRTPKEQLHGSALQVVAALLGVGGEMEPLPTTVLRSECVLQNADLIMQSLRLAAESVEKKNVSLLSKCVAALFARVSSVQHKHTEDVLHSLSAQLKAFVSENSDEEKKGTAVAVLGAVLCADVACDRQAVLQSGMDVVEGMAGGEEAIVASSHIIKHAGKNPHLISRCIALPYGVLDKMPASASDMPCFDSVCDALSSLYGGMADAKERRVVLDAVLEKSSKRETLPSVVLSSCLLRVVCEEMDKRDVNEARQSAGDATMFSCLALGGMSPLISRLADLLADSVRLAAEKEKEKLSSIEAAALSLRLSDATGGLLRASACLLEKMTEPAMLSSAVSCLSPALSSVLAACHSKTPFGKAVQGLACAAVCRLCDAVGGRSTGPFDSSLLAEWGGWMAGCLCSVATRPAAIAMWKATFATAPRLVYPETFKKEVLPHARRWCVPFPSEGKKDSSVGRGTDSGTDDGEDSAMSVSLSLMMKSASATPKEKKKPLGATTFGALSGKEEQEGEKGKEKDTIKAPKTPQSASRSGGYGSKMMDKLRESQKKNKSRRFALVDEDSVDYVAVSDIGKKIKLTEHQREMFGEKRDKLAFMDEDSQTGSLLRRLPNSVIDVESQSLSCAPESSVSVTAPVAAPAPEQMDCAVPRVEVQKEQDETRVEEKADTEDDELMEMDDAVTTEEQKESKKEEEEEKTPAKKVSDVSTTTPVSRSGDIRRFLSPQSASSKQRRSSAAVKLRFDDIDVEAEKSRSGFEETEDEKASSQPIKDIEEALGEKEADEGDSDDDMLIVHKKNPLPEEEKEQEKSHSPEMVEKFDAKSRVRHVRVSLSAISTSEASAEASRRRRSSRGRVEKEQQVEEKEQKEPEEELTSSQSSLSSTTAFTTTSDSESRDPTEARKSRRKSAPVKYTDTKKRRSKKVVISSEDEEEDKPVEKKKEQEKKSEDAKQPVSEKKRRGRPPKKSATPDDESEEKEEKQADAPLSARRRGRPSKKPSPEVVEEEVEELLSVKTPSSAERKASMRAFISNTPQSRKRGRQSIGLGLEGKRIKVAEEEETMVKKPRETEKEQSVEKEQEDESRMETECSTPQKKSLEEKAADESTPQKEGSSAPSSIPATPVGVRKVIDQHTPGILKKVNSPSTADKRAHRVHFSESSVCVEVDPFPAPIKTPRVSSEEKARREEREEGSSAKTPVRSVINEAEAARPERTPLRSMSDSVPVSAMAAGTPLSKSTAVLFPPLAHCTDPIVKIVNRLAPQGANSMFIRKSLESKSVRTIGDLARMQERAVDTLAIRKPRIEVARTALRHYLETCHMSKTGASMDAAAPTASPNTPAIVRCDAMRMPSPQKAPDAVESAVEESVEKSQPEKGKEAEEQAAVVVKQEETDNVELASLLSSLSAAWSVDGSDAAALKKAARQLANASRVIAAKLDDYHEKM